MDVMASVSSLVCTLRSGFSDQIDPVVMGREELAFFSKVLDRGIKQRDALNRPEQFFDIRFSDIIGEPVATIAGIYEHFNLRFTTEARDAMQRYIDNKPRGRHGKHRYTLDQFGLSQEEHGPLFDDYCRRFGVATG
jgi:hypothetical protein